MADKYDKNGYNSSDFKRNPQDMKDQEQEQDGEDGSKINEKAGEYMRELLSEKIKLNNAKFPISSRLIDSGLFIYFHLSCQIKHFFSKLKILKLLSANYDQ